MTAFWIILIVGILALIQVAYYQRHALRKVSYTRSFSRRRCFADRVDSGPSPAPPRHAEASLPEFSPGAERAAFLLAGGGDDLRLEFLPAGARGVAYRVR